MMASDDESSEIGIAIFSSGVDDFEEYVDLFETAVNLATVAPTTAEKEKAYWQWLPLRLDKPARAILAQAKRQVQARAQALNPPRDATWPELKEELKVLLIDPQEEYKWHAKLMTIKWDGVESFHVLASRVISAVNKFDRKMDDEYKKREYFTRFRMALPKEPYQDAIDMNVGFENPSIEKAKTYALRAQLTQKSKGENLCFANEGVSEQCVPTAHPFAFPAAHPTVLGDHARWGALGHAGGLPPPEFNPSPGMDDLVTPAIESALAGINTQLEDLKLNVRSSGTRLEAIERDVDALKHGAYASQQSNPCFWFPQNQYHPPYPHWPSQQYYPNMPHGQNSPYFPQNYPPNEPQFDHGGQNQSGCGGQESSGDGAGSYESEADLEAELARQREEMERTMARLESKRRGY